MTTISQSVESKLYRFEAEPRSHWFDDPYNSVRGKYQSIFADEDVHDEPLSPPIHDPEPPVHTD